MSDRLELAVERDSWTSRLQLSISKLDEHGAGDGYRIAGPKFNGSSKPVLTAKLTERDAAEIRSYLDAVFPVAGDAEVQYAVAYGGEDAENCAGKFVFDDPGAAEEQVQWINGGFLAKRTITYGPWERIEAATGEPA